MQDPAIIYLKIFLFGNGNQIIAAHLIIINYFENTSQCRLKFPLNTSNYHLELQDLLTGQRYIRLVSEINEIGMFIELKGYQAHIFEFFL